ncbi:hypothetical protein GUJ93_ZPchr0006g42192 [Zizania palustris]|uniref:Uncharacterized protein n=1 Tax=Zizania palustris TaxID=103762 RepID=A0A8J5SDD1_ZIZPA|nr:hypothetical protein GUJ93_ZPchr0006g42192 [Zizania palustris]
MSQHVFNHRTQLFCLSLDPSFTNIDPEEDDIDAPSVSRSVDAARVTSWRGVRCHRCSSLGTSMYTFIV